MKEAVIHYFFQRFFKKNQSKKKKKEYKNYNDIKTVLILFESDCYEKNTEIQQIIKELSDEGKQVDALGYVDKKEISTSIRSNFKILGNKDINWLEKPNSTILHKTEKKEYDLLIDFNINSKTPLLYLNAVSNSLLKTGLYNDKYNLLDFSIHKEKNIKSEKELEIMDIFQQISFYLKKIEAKR